MQKTYARLLQIFAVIAVIIAGILYAFMLPEILGMMAAEFPELSYLVTPGMIAIGVAGLPVLIAVVLFLQICGSIAADDVFSDANAKRLRSIGCCAVADTVYALAFTVFLAVSGAFNGGVLLLSFAVLLAGTAVAIAAFLLSGIVKKAALNGNQNTVLKQVESV